MIDKKEFLLHSIIKAYIENLEPIGSSQLKSMYDISYSSATIRGYFKKLGDEGFLAQEHISSGRTPTNEALKQYWTTKLNFPLKNVNKRALEILSSEIGLSVFVKKEQDNILKNILLVDEKYLILEFLDIAVTIKYSDVLYRFLKDFINFSIKDILKISKDVGAFELYNSINNKISNRDFEIFNSKEFLALALNSFLKGDFLDKLDEGIYFDGFLPQNYIAICHICKMEDEDVKILTLGELSKDYEYFFNQIKI